MPLIFNRPGKNVRTILAVLMLAASLGVAPVAVASTAFGFGTGSVPATQEYPTTVTFSTIAVGKLFINAIVDGKGGTLTVTGPLSCTSSTKARNKAVSCYFPTAPIGDWTLTISPNGNYSIFDHGYVEGEIQVPQP